jgi:hypothetical protein
VPEPESKRCGTCGEIKLLSEFNRRSARRYQSKCRACNSEYLKEHYAKNLAYYVDKAARFKKRQKTASRTKILAYLADHPCVDCSETDPIVLQFDHVRGVKISEVAKMVADGRAWKWIEAEIGKCEVRCANCHIRRTAKQHGWHGYMN